MIRIGTLFSGIGAFEAALKQMNIPHEIMFACDNGEIELVPLDSVDRKEFKALAKKKEPDDESKERISFFKGKIEGAIEHIRKYSLSLGTKRELHRYVSLVYKLYRADKENAMRKTYEANYEIDSMDFYTDVRFMNGKFYKNDIDIIVGGSPCQSFSTYGKKRGLEDTRGTLFYDYARLIKEIQPKVFIYENVPGLLTHDAGRTWHIMLDVWESLGYHLKWKKLNSKDYNHPQNRIRLFLIGFREDIYNHEYRFPEKVELKCKSFDYLEPSPVDDKYYLGQKGFEWVTKKDKNRNKTRFNRDVIGCETANQQFNWIGDLRVEHPSPKHYSNPDIYIGKYDGEDAVARMMTPRECLRLMGFDDSFKIVVSDKDAYRQAGNSIVVPVLKEIIRSIRPYLE
ncbi:MAG: DNA cytosine methyltransferase [Bacteroidaceae bacterium]|nr:DNA cytosine methyltransferase [Bacteroidaceae bacterium]